MRSSVLTVFFLETVLIYNAVAPRVSSMISLYVTRLRQMDVKSQQVTPASIGEMLQLE